MSRPRRVLITGAAGAIGQAVAERLRRGGHRVAGLDLVAGPGIHAADLRDEAATRAAVAAAAQALGGLDVLVNNAGVAELRDSGAAPSARTRALLEVNLLGAWSATAAALPALLAARGRVVNVSSLLAFANMPLLAGYSASKRALAALSDVLRVEYGADLSVVTVYPGYVRTPLHAAARDVGLRLDGLLPEESLDQAADAVAGACTGRPRRDVAASWTGEAVVRAGRWCPAALDRLTRWRLRRLAAGGRLDAPIARPLVARLLGRAPAEVPPATARPPLAPAR